jgi:hypothetical protein
MLWRPWDIRFEQIDGGAVLDNVFLQDVALDFVPLEDAVRVS